MRATVQLSKFAGRTAMSIGRYNTEHQSVEELDDSKRTRKLTKDLADEVKDHTSERQKQTFISLRRREDEQRLHVGQRIHQNNMKLLNDQRLGL